MRSLRSGAFTGALASIVLLTGAASLGNDCYTYTVIARQETSQTGPLLRGWPRLYGFGMNSLGQVAFGAQRDASSGGTEQCVVLGDGVQQQILHCGTDPEPSYSAKVSVGVNDQGRVLFPAFNDGLYVVDAGSSPVQVLEVAVDAARTAKDINNQGQFAWYENDSTLCSGGSNNTRLLISDGQNLESRSILEQCPTRVFVLEQVVVNEEGFAAGFGYLELQGETDPSALFVLDPAQPVAGSLVLGDRGEWQFVGTQLGFNDHGLISFTTSSSTGAWRLSVVTLEGAGNLDVLGGASWVDRFISNTSINNLNEVLFLAQETSSGPTLAYTTDPLTTSRRVFDPGDLTDGGEPLLRVGKIGNPGSGFPFISTSSMNDQGQIVFSGVIDIDGDLTDAIIRADPTPGCSPGNPILPDKPLNTGWQFTCGERDPPGCWFDPAPAVGYEYAVVSGPAIASAVIPAPLINGDEDFVIEFDAFSEPLKAGEAFDFTAQAPAGVSTFRITRIDTSEMLDPEDPQAFVTGLTFVGEAPVELTMIPITDTDSDALDDVDDNCPFDANPDQVDGDRDGRGDVCDNCPLIHNATQSDFDADQQGNVCDIDDGEIFLRFDDPALVGWDLESSYLTWNLYQGDLSILLADGLSFTQDPGTVPLARQQCGLSSPASQAVTPMLNPGEAVFFLTTGIDALGDESGLGGSRTNGNPCP